MGDRYYIFDIDGTLASVKNRAQYKGVNWDRYHLLGETAQAIPHVMHTLLSLAERHRIIICTARRQHRHAATKMWLSENRVPYSRLVMADDDHLSARDKVNNMLANLHGVTKSDCICWFDDDPTVIAAGLYAGFNMVQVFE